MLRTRAQKFSLRKYLLYFSFLSHESSNSDSFKSLRDMYPYVNARKAYSLAQFRYI